MPTPTRSSNGLTAGGEAEVQGAGVACGVLLPNFDPERLGGLGRNQVLQAARLAEQLEFESLWAGDHLACPAPGLDAPTCLAAAAAPSFSAVQNGLLSPNWTQSTDKPVASGVRLAALAMPVPSKPAVTAKVTATAAQRRGARRANWRRGCLLLVGSDFTLIPFGLSFGLCSSFCLFLSRTLGDIREHPVPKVDAFMRPGEPGRVPRCVYAPLAGAPPGAPLSVGGARSPRGQR